MEIDTRALQMRELEILKEVMAVCNRNGLRYWADGGTCIGAARHGGFIPWDDDVDIGMPRPDFDKFRQLAAKELPDWLALQDYENTRHARHSVLKVHDVRTTFVEEDYIRYPEAYTGIYIDIFCFDGFPPPGQERDGIVRQREKFSRLDGFLRGTWRDTKTAGQKVRYILFYPCRLLLSFNWASMCKEELYRKCSFDKAEWVSECFDWAVYPAAYVRETVTISFEGLDLPCPAMYDEFLTTFYGDWRQLPPESERTPTHPVAWFSMERSYRERWWEKE